METKTALLVIYNHRFDTNISRINKLYSHRFSNVFHIMPFYDGKEPNVIPVFDSSYCFSGYIAQAYSHLRTLGFTHFFIIADDLILNPQDVQIKEATVDSFDALWRRNQYGVI